MKSGITACSHANLPGMTQAEMKREIDGIAERCAAYRIPRPQTFAYPGLTYTADSVAYLRPKGIPLPEPVWRRLTIR